MRLFDQQYRPRWRYKHFPIPERLDGETERRAFAHLQQHITLISDKDGGMRVCVLGVPVYGPDVIHVPLQALLDHMRDCDLPTPPLREAMEQEVPRKTA